MYILFKNSLEYLLYIFSTGLSIDIVIFNLIL